MFTLDKSIRNSLENIILEARYAAEEASRIALEALGVGEKITFPYLSEAEKTLRRRLRSHGRQLGDSQYDDGKQTIEALKEEVAYQNWHRMLFARFLAENNLLMDNDPVTPISMTLQECNDLAPSLGARNGWELAAKFASNMLPQIFKKNSPVFSIEFPIEWQKQLEQLISSIPEEVFHASDSLGWVYQFWQTKRKKEINDSGVKIGARELPAVTQLFTEPYMVSFLLDNSLGAWWAAKKLNRYDLTTASDEQELRDKVFIENLPLEYLRFVKKEEEDLWEPAGGSFDAWPQNLSEFKMLDPCCGSGHFLVAMLQMLVPMRMEMEELSEDEAIQKILVENIHGLELDQRCVELAAFALAFAAWTYPGSSGYRKLPALNIACSGQAIHISDDEILRFSNGNNDLYNVLENLRNKFQQAPILGSLIDPKHSIQENGLFSLDWEEVEPLLDVVLRKNDDFDLDEVGIVAQGIAKASTLLTKTYHLVATNVPYLSRKKQHSQLKKFIKDNYIDESGDLATAFLSRIIKLLEECGRTSVVLPQNWLFQANYENMRLNYLNNNSILFIATLGEKAFESTQAAGALPCLLNIQTQKPGGNHKTRLIEAAKFSGPSEKSNFLLKGLFSVVNQSTFLTNESYLITSHVLLNQSLGEVSSCYQGTSTGDNDKFIRFFTEMPKGSTHVYFVNPPDGQQFFSGRKLIVPKAIFGKGHSLGAVRGRMAWNKKGIAIGKMRSLPATLYSGEYFSNTAPVIICDESILPAIWSFASSPSFNKAMKQINPNIAIENGYVEKISWDEKNWRNIAKEQYPNGLPLPFSNDPTQWIFHGHPCKSVIWDDNRKWTTSGPIRFDSTVLHIAVARLLGYRWPAEFDSNMELAKEQRDLVSECNDFHSLSDEDGIVCIPSVGGKFAADDRLLKLLKTSYGNYWTDETLSTLLKDSEAAGKTLEFWLRNKFFNQHCKIFGNRPFIWHVWDGLPDGFSVLVNYHKLDYKKLETIIYNYLGDWIQRQKIDSENKIEGARERLSAAQVLSQRLELILKGENPYDIFVRWKSLSEQPIGWNPDLNDGVRLNIRPFMNVPDIGRKGTGVLRHKPNVKWDKDRGKDKKTAPWYDLGPTYGGEKGDRINDHHLSLEEKLQARRVQEKR